MIEAGPLCEPAVRQRAQAIGSVQDGQPHSLLGRDICIHLADGLRSQGAGLGQGDSPPRRPHRIGHIEFGSDFEIATRSADHPDHPPLLQGQERGHHQSEYCRTGSHRQLRPSRNVYLSVGIHVPAVDLSAAARFEPQCGHPAWLGDGMVMLFQSFIEH